MTDTRISPAADSWTEWNGGECPVAPGDLVERRYRHAPDFDRTAAPADMWRWQHTGDTHDIIAYRVVSA